MNAQVSENHLHNRTSEAIRRLRQIENRLNRVTNNICGPVPESAANETKPTQEHLHDKMDVASNLLALIEDELCRLENAVGQNQPQPAKTVGGVAAGY